MNNQAVNPKNIRTLLENDQYIIPIYQRNFAWKEEQILQLLNDIWNISDDIQHYYVGTLVVNKREDGKIEVIDGQQRLTAFNIINAVMRQNGDENAVAKRNLFFEVREKSEQILDNLLDKGTPLNLDDSYEAANILSAAKCVENFISEKRIEKTEAKNVTDDEKIIERMNRNFYGKTCVFISELPKGTNLNHYFEIMNNRGEQLEQHEILKARLLKNIDPKQQDSFASIWDACSQMNCHVLSLFDDKECACLFDENNGEYSVNAETVESQNEPNKENEQDKEIDSFSDICEKHKLPEKFSQEKKDQRAVKFGSIIDFPNFLLVALKIFSGCDGISLDGDNLEENFDKVLNNEFDAAKFIRSLFRYRVLFDSYVIKREYTGDEWVWCMKKCIKSKNEWLFENSISDEDIRRKMRMLQSMLQVDNIQNKYKYWLEILLRELNGNVEVKKIYGSLYKYAEDNFRKYTGKDNWYRQGLATPSYVFNYSDYQLWLFYYDYVRGDKTLYESLDEPIKNLGKIIANCRKDFSTFKFTYRNSREHLYPRNRFNNDDNLKDEEKNIADTSFGNLCLISNSSNSSWGDALPIQKRWDAIGNKANESLKLKVMFASFNDNANEGNKWGIEEIKKHEKLMVEFLTWVYSQETKENE